MDSHDSTLEKLAAQSRMDKLRERLSWIDERIQIIEDRADLLFQESSGQEGTPETEEEEESTESGSEETRE